MKNQFANTESLDTKACLLYHSNFLLHECDSPHVENSERIKPLLKAIQTHPIYSKLPNLDATECSKELLFRSHAKEMVESLLSLRGKRGWLDNDTYYGEKSVETALLAAGGCADLALKIWKGEYRRGFSFVRPPGHHATKEEAMGFCLFNNVAVAVQAVLNESPQARIAVVDYDLHHGNGTQWAFYDNPNVLFLSSHRFPYYPGTGSIEEIGEGKGKGTTVNFPLNRRYTGDFFARIYNEVALPILEEFSPEILFVSAGFDGHVMDPMQGFQMQTETYGSLAETLMSAAEKTAKGRILFCLEGGYDPDALCDSSLITLQKMVELPIGYSQNQNPLKVFPEEMEFFSKYYKNYFKKL